MRLWGIGFGLPALYHPDEPAYVLQALAVGRGLPDGLTFANPPLYKYLLLGEYAFTYAGQRLIGVTRSPQDFVDQFRADPSRLYLIARVTSATLGALTVLAAGVLGTQVGGRRVGLLAAVLTAVTYLLVRDSHFAVNDALATLLVTVGLVYCVRIVRAGSRRDYLIAGALAGLAFSAKYYGIALLAPLVLAHALRPWSARRHAELVWSLVACLAAAVVTFPSLVTEPGRVLGDVYVHLYLEATGGYDGLDPAGGYTFYAKTLALGLGWPLLLAALCGLGLTIATLVHPTVPDARWATAAIVVAALPVVLIGVLGAEQLYFARFLLPALPALVVEAALALDWLITLQHALGLAAVLLVGASSLVDVIRFDSLLSQADTRTLASDWIDSAIPSGATIAVDSAPLGPTLLSAQGHQVLVANDFSLFDLSPADYRARGVEYIAASSFTSEARAVDPTREARRRTFASSIGAEGIVVAQFRPYDTGLEPPFMYDQIYGPFNALDQLARPGPTVTVYRLN